MLTEESPPPKEGNGLGPMRAQRLRWSDRLGFHALDECDKLVCLLREEDDSGQILRPVVLGVHIAAVLFSNTPADRLIHVERAPTHFGSLSLRVTGTREGVQVRFDPLWREPPRQVLLHLPKSRPLGKPVEGLAVITRSGQQDHWDFPTVVRLYHNLAASSHRPTP